MLLPLLVVLSLPARAVMSLADAQAILLIEDQRLPAAALATYVQHPDAETRARAARGLGRLRDPAALAGLRRIAADPEVAVRREVAFALGQTPSAMPDILARLALEGDAQARAALLEALGKQGDADAVPVLVNALDVPPGLRAPPEPRAAALALGRLSMRDVVAVRTPMVAAHLLDLLRRFDRPTHQAAAFALARLEVHQLPDAARDELLARARDDWDPVVRSFLVRAASRLDLAPLQVQALLSEAVRDPTSQVRVAAARAAAHVGWPGVAVLLHDPDRGVRRETISAVGAIPELDAEALLRPLIEAGANLDAQEDLASHGDPRLLEAAAAVRALGARGALPEVEQDLAPQMPTRIRIAAIRSLDDIDRLLGLALDDSEPGVRTAAAVRLTELEPEAAVIVRLFDATDPIVAAIAADHLTSHPAASTEDRLVGALVSTDDPDLLRAAAEALAARYQGHPNPPLIRNKELMATLQDLCSHDDPLVRTAAQELRRSLGVVSAPEVHHMVNVPLEEVGRIQGARILTSRGEVRVDLLPEEAPLTVWNFAGLADQGFYDNRVIHRVVPDFVVQDGDPRGDGYGGPGWTIPDEINPVPYTEGTLGMALSGPDTGGSQWFITLSPQPHLDGGYTAFGHVTYGLGTLRQLQLGDRILQIRIERAPEPEAAAETQAAAEPEAAAETAD